MADKERGPMNAAQELFTTMQTKGLAATVPLTHPAEITKFHDLMMPVFDAEHSQGKRESLDRFFGTGASMEEIKQANPPEFMSRMLSALAPSFESVQWQSIEIIGTAREGDVVHVVTRIHLGVGETKVIQLQIFSFKEFEGNWKMMMSGDIQNMAPLLRASIEKKSK